EYREIESITQRQAAKRHVLAVARAYPCSLTHSCTSADIGATRHASASMHVTASMGNGVSSAAIRSGRRCGGTVSVYGGMSAHTRALACGTKCAIWALLAASRLQCPDLAAPPVGPTVRREPCGVSLTWLAGDAYTAGTEV